MYMCIHSLINLVDIDLYFHLHRVANYTPPYEHLNIKWRSFFPWLGSRGWLVDSLNPAHSQSTPPAFSSQHLKAPPAIERYTPIQ